MKKNFASLNSLLFILFAIALVFIFLQPQRYDDKREAPLSEFSTKRALQKIKIISEKPHYVGSPNHDEIANYLITELKNLGLQPNIQEGYTLTEWGNLVKSKNIYATIKGNNNTKSLLLISHYDSAPHSFSKGASDDASGVATVLETVRAFMHSKAAKISKNKNDIVILFTDAEELGLNGAALFATKNKLAKNVGLALNFEARGTSGPSYMLMETTNGNSKMVEEFSKAKVHYPVSNSLMYSIYKMLPNDTDLTVLREQKNIQGFNFAFIDNHFNYHTSQDNYQNVSPNSVAHQGSYLVPLLKYFSNADLYDLKSTTDKVYFSLPFLYLSYSNQWILPILLISIGLFFLFIFIGLGKQIIHSRTIFIGFGKLFLAILLCGGITFFGWKIILAIYPQYAEIQQGFPYNGHFYIYAFLSLSVAICFLVFGSKEKRNPEMSLTIAPISIWFLINTVMAFKLEGASFLIIPVIFSVIMLAVFVLTQKKFWFLNCLLSLPAILLIVPLIQMFPVGLGLKILFGSTILVALTFALLLPIFGGFLQKKLCSLLFVLISIGFFIAAHLNSEYTTNQAKPNSLLYSYNTDTKKAFWLSYDQNPDAFTKTYLGENPQDASVLNNMPLFSKYNSQFTLMAKAPIKNIASPTVVFSKDSISGNQRYLKITIMPNRKVNRYDIFASLKMGIFNFKANGVQNINQKSIELSRNGQKILSYYVVNNEPLVLEFSIPKSQKLELSILESSFDLFSNPNFNLTQRSPKFIPAPFVLTDAVCIIQKIKPTKLVVDKETADNTDLPVNKRNMVPNVFAIDTLKMNNLSGSILGCGWLGLPLAKKLVADGFKIKASKTNSQDFDSLKSFGISPFVIELTPEKSVGDFESFLKEASFLIIDIPPGLRIITNDTDSFINKIKHCIPFIEASSVKQVVFISSTSVYGDSENYLENTTENTAVNPDSESGRQLVLIENLLLENTNFKTIILRFGGLIGPNRNPIKYLAGKKDVANPYAPINFIHQEDCIEIIRKIVSNSPIESTVFNAVAPFHPTRKNYYGKKAKEENLEIPEFDTAKKSIGKKISSQKLQSELNYTFMHSSL